MTYTVARGIPNSDEGPLLPASAASEANIPRDWSSTQTLTGPDTPLGIYLVQ